MPKTESLLLRQLKASLAKQQALSDRAEQELARLQRTYVPEMEAQAAIEKLDRLVVDRLLTGLPALSAQLAQESTRRLATLSHMIQQYVTATLNTLAVEAAQKEPYA